MENARSLYFSFVTYAYINDKINLFQICKKLFSYITCAYIYIFFYIYIIYEIYIYVKYLPILHIVLSAIDFANSKKSNVYSFDTL